VDEIGPATQEDHKDEDEENIAAASDDQYDGPQMDGSLTNQHFRHGSAHSNLSSSLAGTGNPKYVNRASFRNLNEKMNEINKQ